MRDFFEALDQLVRQVSGYEIPREFIPWLILMAATVPFVLWLSLSIRRWRGDFRAISGDMQGAVEWINHDMRQELGQLYRKFEGLHQDFSKVVMGRLEALQVLLKSTEEVSGETDAEVAADDDMARPVTRQTRLSQAENVRNAVVNKWIEGRPLTQVAMNCFQFEGTAESGNAIRLYFQTPYRPTIATDGRLPFTLEVWVNNRKHLNFEWDADGRYRLRGFKRGEWIADVAEWQFPVGQSQVHAA
ncbi:MAG: hypothetical protein ACK5JT_04005 [Hyphomicrobiaceae bacterium]